MYALYLQVYNVCVWEVFLDTSHWDPTTILLKAVDKGCIFTILEVQGGVKFVTLGFLGGQNCQKNQSWVFGGVYLTNAMLLCVDQYTLSYTARCSLHQVHGSQCTKEYYTKYSWRTLADECMVSEVLRVVRRCRVLL